MHKYLIIFFLLIIIKVNGQNGYTLNFLNEDYKAVKKNPKTEFKDSLSLISYLKEFRNSAVKSGYILASIDSVYFNGNVANCAFYLGDKFSQIHLSIDPEELVFMKRKASVAEKFYTQASFNPSEVSMIIEKTISTYENNGYPFVALNFVDTEIKDGELFGKLSIDRGKEYRWTEIHLRGDSSINKSFISGVLKIHESDLYSQKDLDEISETIAQINFLSEIKAHEILFTPDGCELFLYLKSNPLSSINGVLGLQQNAETNKLSVTGDLALRLVNALHKGESINLNYKSIRDETQSLDTKANLPFLFKSPFGVEGAFKLYKRDSSFLELKASVGIQYFFKGGNYVKVFYARNSSSVLSGGKNNTTFQNLRSVNTNNYGLAYFRQRVDYIPNPSKGYSSIVSLSTGQRSTRDLDSNQILKTQIFRIEFDASLFLPISKRYVIKIGNRTESYYAPEIFQNELLRFGGLNSQRGFNEEELLASTFSTFNVELRYLLDRNSRVFLFADQSFYENTSNGYLKDAPIGFGAGFSFGTNIGIFNLSYALGKQQNNPILIKNGKIHFGYVAFF